VVRLEAVHDEHLAGVSLSGQDRSGSQGTGSDDPCLPTGDGEATSHSAPLEDRTLWFRPSDDPEIVMQSPGLALWPWTGDGEHRSPLEPVGGPHPGAQGAEPPHYPDSIAQSDTGLVGGDELGLQAHFVAVATAGDLADLDPQEISSGIPCGYQLELFCPSWGIVGECVQGHHFAKELICNREWCVSCGGNGGKAHQRRKAAWLPKARQLSRMGSFVITIPPELRDKFRAPYQLSAVGTAFKRMFKRHGFDRGLRRWHWFGEDHPGHGLQGDGLPVYHPHLNVLVEAGWLPQEKIDAIRSSVATILGVDLGRVNVHYQYATAVPQMLHLVKYVLRPTFEHWEWDQEMAYNLVGFRNALTWGKWDDAPAWEMPVSEPATLALEAIESGRCPIDGSAIHWVELVGARQLVKPWWEPMGAGYHVWNGLARDGPGDIS